MNLSDSDKRELLRIARVTLKEFLLSGRIPPGKPHKETLLLESGGAVALLSETVNGMSDAVPAPGKPLYLLVQEGVVAAAKAANPGPVTLAEFEHLNIEVSLEPGPCVFSEINLGQSGKSERSGL